MKRGAGMRRASAGLLLGAVVMSVFCVTYGAVALRAQGGLEGRLQAEIESLPPELFTVLALPPGYEMLGPQGLTAEQVTGLSIRLGGVADMATVSICETSASDSLIQTDGTVVLLKPPIPYVAVSANYFDLMGYLPMEGRFFSAQEEEALAKVCVVAAGRPEVVGAEHSDSEGDISTPYAVVGRLPPIKGDPFPLPRIWARTFWRSERARDPELTYMGNRLVYTPATVRAPLPREPQFDRPTWRVPLVAPKPGQSEPARAIVRDYMEEVWPGATLDFGLAGWMVMALEQATSRVRAYGSAAFVLMLALCVVGTAGFMVLAMARRRRATAIQRSLGKSRLLILFEAAGAGTGLALAGAILGALVGALLLGNYLLERMAAGALWPLLKRLAWIAGLAVGAGCLAGVWTAFWATDAPPVQGLRQASVVPSRRAIDFRLPLAVLAVSLGTAVLVCLLVSSRSSVAALSGYLRSVGERVILVEQDIFAAQGPLRREDFLGPANATTLREGLPEWMVVSVSVASTTAIRPDGVSQPVTAFGVDQPWPEEAGFRLDDGRLPDFVDIGDKPVVYMGSQLAKRLFGTDPAVGQELVLGDGRARVAVGGVLAPRPEGVPDRLGDRDESLFVPVETLRRAADLTPPGTTTEIWVYLPPGLDKDQGQAAVAAIVDQMGGAQTGLKAEALIDQVSRLSRLESDMARQQILLAAMALAAAAWLVGMVMLARLADRRRELGLRRAVGAPPWQIGLAIIGESVLICLAGGVLGSALGLLLAAQYCQALSWPMVSGVRAPLEVLGAVVLLGLLVALMPVRQALGSGPMRSLREGEM